MKPYLVSSPPPTHSYSHEDRKVVVLVRLDVVNREVMAQVSGVLAGVTSRLLA